MRDGVYPDEEYNLVQALRAGKTWDEVRGSLPDVDPAHLDKEFRERCFRQAGLLLADPPQAESQGLKPTRKPKG